VFSQCDFLVRTWKTILCSIHFNIFQVVCLVSHKKMNSSQPELNDKQPLSMFFVELKPAPNNKDIFNAGYIQQCKIQFEPPKHKRDIVQCANCQRYGHTKNYYHLKPRCVKCAGDHLTNQCHGKERSSDFRCVLCGGYHPGNYKGCTVYKDLQKKTYPPLFETIHSSCTNQTHTLNQE
jgi:hypothetical protein